MKSLTLLLSLFLCVGASAASFEGKVKMKMTNGRSEHALTYSMKGGLVRTDFEISNGQTASAILDVGRDQMTMLMPAQQMYMVMPMRRTAAAAGHDPADVQLEKTSETEKILGYTCTKYLVKSKEGTTEVWATDQLGTFMGLGAVGNPMSGRQAPAAAWEKVLKDKNFFPLRVVGGDKSNAFKLEAVAVEKQSIPDSVFSPPADYRKFDLGGFPGMGGGSPFGKRDE